MCASVGPFPPAFPFPQERSPSRAAAGPRCAGASVPPPPGEPAACHFDKVVPARTFRLTRFSNRHCLQENVSKSNARVQQMSKQMSTSKKGGQIYYVFLIASYDRCSRDNHLATTSLCLLRVDNREKQQRQPNHSCRRVDPSLSDRIL